MIKYKYKSDLQNNQRISFSKKDRIRNRNKNQIHKSGYNTHIKKIIKFSILFLSEFHIIWINK